MVEVDAAERPITQPDNSSIFAFFATRLSARIDARELVGVIGHNGPGKRLCSSLYVACDIDRRPSVLLMVGADLRTPASELPIIDSDHLKSTYPIQCFIGSFAPLVLKPGA
jgi:hypothetical protein